MPVMQLRLLAKRPFTQCFQGLDKDKGTGLFIKCLHSSEPGIIKNFLREIEVLKIITGKKGFPELYGYSTTPDNWFHAVNFIHAPRFDQYLTDTDLADILHLGFLLAKQIDTLHHLGYAHRDLSPDHIFMYPENTVTLVDFGMAKYVASLQDSEKALCIGYDIQAVGLILWELICGKPIFSYRSASLLSEIHNELTVIASLELPAQLEFILSASLSSPSEMTPEGIGEGKRFHCVKELLYALQPA